MQPEGYVYVIVRNDLPQPHLSIQAGHAILAATNTFIGSAAIRHPNLVLCQVANEQELAGIFNSLKEQGVPCCAWTEDDMSGSLTAVATAVLRGKERKPFRKMRLLS